MSVKILKLEYEILSQDLEIPNQPKELKGILTACRDRVFKEIKEKEVKNDKHPLFG